MFKRARNFFQIFFRYILQVWKLVCFYFLKSACFFFIVSETVSITMPTNQLSGEESTHTYTKKANDNNNLTPAQETTDEENKKVF